MRVAAQAENEAKVAANNTGSEAERELWKLFQSGDQDAFASLYKNYVQVIYNYCRKFTADEVLIEDCIHSLFLDIWKNKENLSLPASVRFYLYASVKRRLYKELSKRKDMLFADDSSLEAALKETGATAEEQLISKQAKAQQEDYLKQGLHMLSENQRQAILLKFYKNLSFQEISGVMNMSTDNIYKLVSRGLAILKRNVKNLHVTQ
ncbi:sigma-70 family RNA polymerase sigma factor [Pontibacter sp. 172403-2]|uniref:RNA polymerase sigma factor n=1 Tax=Pontibacter rufus TaxID=2791028 RepID=UPI0018AF8B04|nr:sigma-70 family RNA polymerase sigma factor [Pontibacter sp. 172403-2]MBF9254089.1 sigma-70 family RNA polymerase sigma factor [Pontibacter sp. 172403-2]